MRLLLLLFVFAAVPASASNYKCELIDAVDDWTIEIDVAEKKAAFFDNDHWSDLVQTDLAIQPRWPRKKTYTYEGVDSHNSSTSLKLSFTQQTKNARLEIEGEPPHFFKCSMTDQFIYLGQ